MTFRVSSELNERFQTQLDALQAEANFPGATAAFMLANEQCATFATGYADKENKIAMTPDMRMLSGSVGKTFVAAVALNLVLEGAIRLDDRIAKWLSDDWVSRMPNGQDITLRMLLTHSSGLPNHNNSERFATTLREQFAKPNPDFYFSPHELVELVLDKQPLFPAGTGFAYSNTGYILVGILIEQVSGNTYYEELHRRFLAPLHLERTSPANHRHIGNLSPGYLSPDNLLGLPEKNMTGSALVFHPATEWTDGGLVTNPQDLVCWASVLYSGQAMAKPYLHDLLNSITRDSARKLRYGLGVTIYETKLGTAYGHTGWTPGYQTIFQYFPFHEVAVAIQVNASNNQDMVTYLQALARVVLVG